MNLFKQIQMPWKTLSLHFRQTYEGGYRYLDKCGEFMLAAAEKYSFIPGDAKPQGAKMEIPEQGVQTTCDTTNLILSQEIPLDDGTYFLTLSKGLSELVKHHFEPKAVVKNGFLWKSYIPFNDFSAAMDATLKLAGEFHSDISKVVGMLPEHKELSYFFASGSKELQIKVFPVTFQTANILARNVDPRATKSQRDQIDRQNRFAERLKEGLHYGLALDVDLIENDPPKLTTLHAHFEELAQKNKIIREVFNIK